jgi:hypothetical protein
MTSKNILLGVLVLILLIGAFILGRSGVETPFNATADSVAKQLPGSTQSDTQETTAVTPGATTNTGGSVSLPQGQLDMLKSFGIDPATVSVTPAMMACAEGKVGAPRFTEIKNGATPTMFEGAKLVTCYK